MSSARTHTSADWSVTSVVAIPCLNAENSGIKPKGGISWKVDPLSGTAQLDWTTKMANSQTTEQR